MRMVKSCKDRPAQHGTDELNPTRHDVVIFGPDVECGPGVLQAFLNRKITTATRFGLHTCFLNKSSQ